MLKRLPIFLVFALITMAGYSQQSKKIDSLQQQLANPSLPKQVKALNELAYIYTKTDSAKTFFYAAKAKQLALKINDTRGLANSYRAMGIAQSYRYREKEALYYLNLAKDNYQKINSLEEVGNVYADMGILYKLYKDHSTALNYFKKAENIHLVGKNENSLISDYNQIGTCFLDMGQRKNAINIFLKGLKLAEKLGLEDESQQLISNMGNVMQQEKNYSEAIRYYQKALNIFRKKNDHLNIGISSLNMSITYASMSDYKRSKEIIMDALSAFTKANFTRGIQICHNNLGALLLRQNNFEEAIPILQTSLDIIKSSPNKAGQALVEQNIGYAYTKLNKLEEAEKWFQKSEESAKKYKADINVYAEIYKHRAMLDSAKGDYYNALIRKSLHAKIKDSLLNEKLSRQIIELQTQYETEKKQTQINSLTSQNTIQLLNLRNKTLALNSSQIENQRNKLDIKNKALELDHKNATIRQKELKAENDAQQISLLNEKSTVQELQIKNRNQTIAIISGLLLTLGIIAAGGFILFRNFRTKAKLKQEQLALENKLLEEQANAKIQEQRLEISRELHDSLGSQLTFISAILDNLKSSPAKMDETVNNKINTLSDFSENSINELKNTIWALNTKELKLNDLKMKLLNFIKNAAEAKEDVRFNFDFDVASNFQLNSKQAINLFRVFQEIINNALKYAKAKNISALVKQKENFLEIGIADDGIGFNLAEAEQKSYGIANIRSRIAEINGKLNIETAANKGTSYQIKIRLI